MEVTIIEQILNYSILGVSIGTILGLTIYVLRYIIKNKHNMEVTETAIVEGFKKVVLPRDLRINLSGKIDPAIQEGMAKYMKPIMKQFDKLMVQNQLMLSIMAKFSHTEKLTDVEQELLANLIKTNNISEINIE
jgi:hypothetical protein